MKFDMFVKMLPYLLKGMLGIFAVTLIIIICIVLLNKLTAPRKRIDNSDKGESSGNNGR